MTKLEQVAGKLAAKGHQASYEYPGYVSITLPDGRIACFGDVNGDYGANWQECRPEDPIDFSQPPEATAEELVEAIEVWIKATEEGS